MIRIKSDVRAGRVVADVALRCVDRKSVMSSNGPSKILHRVVNSLIVSTISSRLFWWRTAGSDVRLLCPCFSPVTPVDDRGEYRLEYIPKISETTINIGPAYRIIACEYRTMAQNPATSKKLAQASPLDHVNKPARVFRGNKNGCECANARVMGGGVATRRGDLRLTITLERWREVSDDPVIVVGENAATVGGLLSRRLLGCAP